MKKKRSFLQKIFLILGIIIIAFVAAVKIYIWQWDHHSSTVGHQLVTNLIKKQKVIASTKTPTNQNPACRQVSSAQMAAGVLIAPSISLQAPVVQGNSDSVLEVAVGHDPNSVWPGYGGRAVLQAHDVSYFVNIDKLKIGSTLIYETTCKKYFFKVVSHKVVKQGSPVYDSSKPTMTLVTCWPTNALWFTPDRYLVNLDEIKATPLFTKTAKQGSNRPLLDIAKTGLKQHIVVPAPVALVAQGLTLQQNSIPMGKLQIAGNPNYEWIQSPAPLDIESLALKSYIGAIKSLEEGNNAWWFLLAPGVTRPSAILSGTTISYVSPLEVTIYAHSHLAYQVTLQAGIDVVSKSGSDLFTETVTIAIRGDQMLIKSFSLT